MSPANPVVVYSGGPFPVSYPGATTGDNPPVCVPFTDTVCSEFALTVAIPATDLNGYKARVSVAWTNHGTTTQGGANSDFDMWVYSPDITGTAAGSSASASNPEVATFDAVNGLYTIYVLPFDVSPDVTFTATVSLFKAGAPWGSSSGNPSFPPGTPRFFNYHAPPGWAEDAGEPSVGVNWLSEKEAAPGSGIFNGGTATYFGGFMPYMLTATFDDRFAPAKVDWKQHDLVVANAPRAFGDPILFTDPMKGRTFVSQELGLSPLGSTMEFTDTDSAPFTPSEGSGAPSGIDHQTVGGGPFAAPIPTGVDPNYGHGVWYCSQSIADAVCSISLDGGITFGPAVPMYTLADCGGLHGHIKIGPDGTAYVPNRGCGDRQAVVVSENNGITWSIRPIPDSTTAERDPSVAVGRDGTLYFSYQDSSGASKVAVSRDKGLTWSSSVDVGAAMGVKNSLFHAAVAGDGDRAAVAFFGTETGGSDYSTPDFPGTWYLYVATTFDRGSSWTTQNATPGDPVQRGGICGDGACRNLLDFYDATIDKRGRVVIGYDDGCISENCIFGSRSYGLKAPNDYTAKAVIARQASGRRMFAAYDSEAGPDVNPVPPPPPPPPVTSCDGRVASDPADDAQHPLLDNVSSEMSQVDITGLTFALSADKQSLVTTITVKDFAAKPVPGSLGTFYYVVWTSAQKNSDGTTASRYYATRAEVTVTGTVNYRFGVYDAAEDAFIGTTTVVTGSTTAGPNGTLNVSVPLALLGNPTIPVTDANAIPAVIEPYALTVIHEQAVRFTTAADRAPNAGSFGASWAVCLAPTVTCIEDDDRSISYSDGWHQINAAGASAGHFRMHLGKAGAHSAKVTFNVSAGKSGKITYHYATSSKGGSAEIFLDGVSKGLINYKGSEGTSHDPKFGASVAYANLAAGNHTLEIRNMSDAVYVDRFCLESSTPTGNPASGPGTTSSGTTTVGALQETLSQLTLPAGTQAISVIAETTPQVPVKLVLVDPAGLTLATADNSSGFAVLDRPVTAGGVYVLKIINLGVGPVNVWTATTPRVAR
ncbi:MAG: sialidase family protein [Acidobacteriota bacterium]